MIAFLHDAREGLIDERNDRLERHSFGALGPERDRAGLDRHVVGVSHHKRHLGALFEPIEVERAVGAGDERHFGVFEDGDGRPLDAAIGHQVEWDGVSTDRDEEPRAIGATGAAIAALAGVDDAIAAK